MTKNKGANMEETEEVLQPAVESAPAANILEEVAKQLAQRSAQTSYKITEREEDINDINRTIDQLKAKREQLSGELEGLRKVSSDLRAAWRFLQPILEGGQHGNSS